MKKIIIFLALLMSLNIYSETYYLENGSIINGVKDESDDKYVVIKNESGSIKVKKEFVFESREDYVNYINRWKRNFIDLSVNGGFSLANQRFLGGTFGLTSAYTFGINKYFAIGKGTSFNFNFYHYDYSFENNLVTYVDKGNKFNFSFLFFDQFMIGDIRFKKIALLLDIGFGNLFGVRAGFFYKGFMIKLGYHLTTTENYFLIPAYNYSNSQPDGLQHSIVIDIGYKFSF